MTKATRRPSGESATLPIILNDWRSSRENLRVTKTSFLSAPGQGGRKASALTIHAMICRAASCIVGPMPCARPAGGRASLLTSFQAGTFSLDRASVDIHDRFEEAQGFRLRTLERVAANDRAEAAAVTDGTHFGKDLLVGSGRATGEDDDAASIEGALHHMVDALGQCRDGNFVLLIDLLRLRLLYMGGGQFHLDDVGAQLGCDLSCISYHIDSSFTLLANGAATRI